MKPDCTFEMYIFGEIREEIKEMSGMFFP